MAERTIARAATRPTWAAILAWVLGFFAFALGPSRVQAAESRSYDDPIAAYEAGAYDEALRLFLDAQLDKPKDPRLALNIGNTYYRKGDFAAAARAYEQASSAEDPELRARSAYNLGNARFRQQQLEEAARAYEQALSLASKDADARHNLELVRQLLTERQRERQQQERQPQQQREQPDEPEDRSDQRQQSGGKDAASPKKQDRQGQQQQQQPAAGDGERAGSQPSGQKPASQEPDADGDGLTDALERTGKNRTDPHNPDTDGDGLTDGEEDANRNGAVDAGETDPTRADSNGDGVPDGQGHESGGRATSRGDGPDQGDTLSREEAERYLRQLGATRPARPRNQRGGRSSRPEKDW